MFISQETSEDGRGCTRKAPQEESRNVKSVMTPSTSRNDDGLAEQQVESASHSFDDDDAGNDDSFDDDDSGSDDSGTEELPPWGTYIGDMEDGPWTDVAWRSQSSCGRFYICSKGRIYQSYQQANKMKQNSTISHFKDIKESMRKAGPSGSGGRKVCLFE